MKDLKSYVQNITKPIIRKNGFVTPQIIFDWPLIVGEEFARHTTPIKITFPAQKNSEGCLHIEVIGAQSLIIQQLEPEIIARVATYFGFKAISRIRLIHSRNLPPLAAPEKEKPVLNSEKSSELDKMVSSVEDVELKEKLKSIGRHIMLKAEQEE